jgi:hypothetical protein
LREYFQFLEEPAEPAYKERRGRYIGPGITQGLSKVVWLKEAANGNTNPVESSADSRHKATHQNMYNNYRFSSL